MKYIITEEQITEVIKLDIKVGDTLLGGKFKNKKVVVKTIGKNEKGDITINGKPLLRFRILKEDTIAKLSNDTDITRWLKRRISKKEMDGYIAHNIDEISHLCDNFYNSHEFSLEVINGATIDYLYSDSIYPNSIELDDEMEDKIKDVLRELFIKHYFDKLHVVYEESCGEVDEDEDEDYEF